MAPLVAFTLSLWTYSAAAADPAAASLSHVQSLIDRGQYRVAAETCREIIAAQPELAPAHMLLGAAHLRSGHPTSALMAFGEAVRLTPPRRLSLEQSLAYIQNDELVEVTPRHVRMRKRLLNPNDRKRAARAAAADVA